MRYAMAWPGALLLASACMVVPDTPLTRAAASGDAARVRDLASQGARPDDADGNGLTPLAYAARAGHVAAIEALMDAGASADHLDARHGWTPLMHAIHKRQEQAVRALL